MVEFSRARERAISGAAPPVSNRNQIYNMDVRQPQGQTLAPPHMPHQEQRYTERSRRDWKRDKPINVDYNQLEADTLANRQRVGWVPKFNKNIYGDETYKTYIPASVAYKQGYFNEPEKIRDIETWNTIDNPNYGKNYFETNPEFKTFFPNDPYYGGLAALKEWQKTGQGIYDESLAMGPRYFGSYNPNEENISMNLGEDLDKTMQEAYGADTSKGYRDTLLHEMIHHWTYQDPYGGEYGKKDLPLNRSLKTLAEWGHSNVITEGENVWNPERKMTEGDWSGTLTADEVQDFLTMHRLGKQQYQGYNRGGIVSLVL